MNPFFFKLPAINGSIFVYSNVYHNQNFTGYFNNESTKLNIKEIVNCAFNVVHVSGELINDNNFNFYIHNVTGHTVLFTPIFSFFFLQELGVKAIFGTMILYETSLPIEFLEYQEDQRSEYYALIFIGGLAGLFFTIYIIILKKKKSKSCKDV